MLCHVTTNSQSAALEACVEELSVAARSYHSDGGGGLVGFVRPWCWLIGVAGNTQGPADGWDVAKDCEVGSKSILSIAGPQNEQSIKT